MVRVVGPNGKVIITNCNICRLCCVGRNVTYEVDNLPPSPPVDQFNAYPIAYPTTPSGPQPTPPVGPGPQTTPTFPEPPVPTDSTPSPPVPTQPVPTQPPTVPSQPYPWPYPYPYPTAPNQYGTAPPSPYPCVPYPPPTDAPYSTTTTATRPPCIYPEPTTTPVVPTNPPTDAPTTPEPIWPSESSTSVEIPTTTPGTPGVTPGPNGECCYIDLRSIQATVSCAAVGTKPGCCTKTCSSSSQVQRQIQINFQLLARYFGQIPPRISCSDAIRFGLVQNSEIAGVCTPQYTPYPIPTGRPDQTTTVVPRGGDGSTIVIPTNGPMDVYPTTPSSGGVAVGVSILSIVLAIVLCL